MHAITYLHFDGNCAEALAFYEKAIGAEVLYVTRYGETPIAADCPGLEDKIINASFKLGDTTLMASDGGPGGGRGHHGYAITLGTATLGEAETVFAALSAGGTVTMAMEETFFAARFGQCLDKFGIPWMVICEKPML